MNYLARLYVVLILALVALLDAASIHIHAHHQVVSMRSQ